MAFRAAPTQGALFFLAPVTVNEGRGDDAIPLEQEGAILYDPITGTVLDPERSEPVEVVDDVNTSVVAALVAEDDVLLVEAAAHADVEGFVPPADSPETCECI